MFTSSFFADIDSGSRTHQACGLNAKGKVLGERTSEYSGEGLGQLTHWMPKCAGYDAGMPAYSPVHFAPIQTACACSVRWISRLCSSGATSPSFSGLKAEYKAWILALWERVPTPAMAHRIRPSTIAKLLKKHRIRRITADTVLKALKAEPVTVASGVEEAAQARIRLYAEQLKAANGGFPDTSSDAATLLSMPGVGPAVVSALLSEAPRLLMLRDYRGLRCLCGVAPVTKRSGKLRYVVRRRASRRCPVNAIYHWSRVTSMHDPISKAKYWAPRKRGHSHARAQHSVAD
ncbi:MAG: transposase [Bacteroidota bacterium]|nr:transposase [Bacteroidota bacterium]MDE2956888.1 transposase [Bacteroidota bacterium]